MRHQWLIGLAVGLLAALCLAPAALAGGGGFTIVYGQGPAWIAVDQPTVISFHIDSACTGLPESNLSPQLTLTNRTNSRALTVLANPDNTAGDYRATIAFPTAGPWSWRLVGGDYPLQTDQLVNVVSTPVAMTKIAGLWPLLRTLFELRVVATLPLIVTP